MIRFIKTSSMKTKILLLALGMGLSLTGFSQTTKEKIDKAANDPQRMENEAKADVLIHEKKIMNNDQQANKTEAKRTDKKKKRSCKKTCKKES
jgi:outer membrane murein-binding lipoprotein Lpp